jgi:hypothetical protein
MLGHPDDFVPVNGAINMKPGFGPIPADQLVPWCVIALFNIVIVNRIFGAGWIPTILCIGWGAATWWVLTGSDASRFLSKFHSPPSWCYGHRVYFTPLAPYPDLNPKLNRAKKTKKAKKNLKKAERRKALTTSRNSRNRPRVDYF